MAYATSTVEEKQKARDYMREYNRTHRERLNEANRLRYAKRKEEDPDGYRGNQNENNRRYHEKHRERLLAEAKAKNWNYNPTRRKDINRKSYVKNWEKVSVHSAKTRARVKGLPFDLDVEWIREKFALGCAVTGLPLDPNGSKTPWTVHVDRIVPENGYTKDNCRLVCACYNLAKKHWTDADVLKMARNLIQTSDS